MFADFYGVGRPKMANFKLQIRHCRMQNWGEMCRITLPSQPSQYNKCDPDRQVAGWNGGPVASLENVCPAQRRSKSFQSSSISGHSTSAHRTTGPSPSSRFVISALETPHQKSFLSLLPPSLLPPAPVTRTSTERMGVFPALTRYQ